MRPKDIPFKIGDKVRRIVCDFEGVKVGGIYTIKGFSGNEIYLVEPKLGGYEPRYFELVKTWKQILGG